MHDALALLHDDGASLYVVSSLYDGASLYGARLLLLGLGRARPAVGGRGEGEDKLHVFELREDLRERRALSRRLDPACLRSRLEEDDVRELLLPSEGWACVSQHVASVGDIGPAG